MARHPPSRLESRLAQPVRDPGDCSIRPPTDCPCELCLTLNTFLADLARRTVDWPIKQQDRRHARERIDRYELPVRHQTNGGSGVLSPSC